MAIFWYFTKLEITQVQNDLESWNLTKSWGIILSKIATLRFLIIWVFLDILPFSSKIWPFLRNFGQIFDENSKIFKNTQKICCTLSKVKTVRKTKPIKIFPLSLALIDIIGKHVLVLIRELGSDCKIQIFYCLLCLSIVLCCLQIWKQEDDNVSWLRPTSWPLHCITINYIECINGF